MNIDVNDVIENLIKEVSKYVRENAILKAQIKSLTETIELNKEAESVDI